MKGDPRFRTWNAEERDGLYAGVWEATPGAWRVTYDEWEFCHILSGVSVLTEDGGAPRRLQRRRRLRDPARVHGRLGGRGDHAEGIRDPAVKKAPARVAPGPVGQGPQGGTDLSGITARTSP